MEIYLVGGAVRDELLGLPVQDRDWLVVGATPQIMESLGFTAVGKDFPVFLHPKTHEEYALARTERKISQGYKGFSIYASPDIGVEEDLARRDLTMNAIAQTAIISDDLFEIARFLNLNDSNKNKKLNQNLNKNKNKNINTNTNRLSNHRFIIDPFGGQNDLKNRVLRHVSDAFKEDPVRILRLARFAARFPDFTVANETLELMKNMVQSGEINALVPERVWQEISKGLMSKKPSRLIEVLKSCDALIHLLPELDFALNQMNKNKNNQSILFSLFMLNESSKIKAPLSVRFSCLMGFCFDFDMNNAQINNENKINKMNEINPVNQINQVDKISKMIEDISKRLRVPNDCVELTLLWFREFKAIQTNQQLDANGLLSLLERCDALRQSERFIHLLWINECFNRINLINYKNIDKNTDENMDIQNKIDFDYKNNYLFKILSFVQSIETAPLAKQAMQNNLCGEQIGEYIRQAREKEISVFMESF